MYVVILMTSIMTAFTYFILEELKQSNKLSDNRNLYLRDIRDSLVKKEE